MARDSGSLWSKRMPLVEDGVEMASSSKNSDSVSKSSGNSVRVL